MRRAVVDSEPLVMVLGSLVRQGLRRLPPDQVHDAIQPLRAAVGGLANTTPSKLFADYARVYSARTGVDRHR